MTKEKGRTKEEIIAEVPSKLEEFEDEGVKYSPRVYRDTDNKIVYIEPGWGKKQNGGKK